MPASTPSVASVTGDPMRLEAARRVITGPFLCLTHGVHGSGTCVGGSRSHACTPLTPEQSRYVALDCEMVGVGEGGTRSALAHVVAVDWLGRVLFNSYVRPAEPVSDYRTFVSGVTAAHLVGAPTLTSVQQAVASLLKGKVLVGHALHNDFKALLLSHPRAAIRDTARHRPFCWRSPLGWKPKRLKHLVLQYLGLHIQVAGAAHDPAEDARAALALYKLVQREWEHGPLHTKTRGAAAKT